MAQENGVDELMQRIAHEYEDLSKQLKVIAQYVDQHRQQMVVVRIQELADACAVQPSAVVRFAQRFGFSGFSELQAVFRDAFSSNTASSSYQQRIRSVIEDHPAHMSSAELAKGVLSICEAGIADLREKFDDSAFEAAVSILQEAEHIYVVGVRRMLPIATYMAYALHHTRKRVVFLDGLGGMYREQIQGLSTGDVLLSISMPPYGSETRYCTSVARERGARVVAITDSALSPISRTAEVTLAVREPEAYSFRALACTMSLAQALFIALAYRLELNIEKPEERNHVERH